MLSGWGPKLESLADKMREIVAMLGWLTPLYLVCVYVSLPNEIKLLLFNIFFFGFNNKMTLYIKIEIFINLWLVKVFQSNTKEQNKNIPKLKTDD